VIPRFATALLIVLAQAQSPAPEPASATPIRITAQIAETGGRPIRNLQARDIELREDGAVQPVLGVEARTPEPRRVAIMLDEFHVSPDATSGVRAAVHWFVEEHLRAGDEVAIVKPLDSLPAIHFTATLERLHDSIEAFDGRKGNYTPRSELEADTVGRSPALAEAARAQIVLSGLRALAARLGGMPGRTAIVLVSEGFVPERRPALALPDAEMVERFANRFDIPIYSLSPSDIRNGEPEQLLRTFASRTGGEFIGGTDLTAALRRVSDDLDGGYVITYLPPHPHDGKFHEVQITVRRKEVSVRARAGYVSMMPIVASARSHTPSVLSNRLLRRSGFVNVWAGVTTLKGTDAHIVVTWEPGRLSGDRRRAARVALKATKPDGTVLYDGTLVPVHSGEVDAVDHAEFDAPAGQVQLDMTIVGSRGEKLDTDARDLTVPAIGPGTLLLPPLMVGTRSAREFRDASDNADTPPEPQRDYSRTERLLIRVPAYSPSPEPPRVTVRLLNRIGQQVHALQQAPGTADGLFQFGLSLAPFAPGDYILEFKATAASGTAEQRVSMRITG
jgi:VWFA-related protein